MRSLLLSPTRSLPRRPRADRARRVSLEQLERREVLSTLSVADVTVREGPASVGILDPGGAASVGLSGIKGIAFNSVPGHPHAGDLFVTGYLSHSVARFDGATQTYQTFVTPANNGGLGDAYSVTVGPDGNVYVSDRTQKCVLRFDGLTGDPLPADGQTGAVFIAAGAGGLASPHGITFGADSNLYVSSRSSTGPEQVLEYQGPAGPSPGAFVRVFANITNGSGPHELTFGPDGNLYVSLINDRNSTSIPHGQINRYDGSTGAPIGTGVFVPKILQPRGIVFDPQGINMYVIEDQTGNGYVSSLPGPMGQVVRHQGPSGQNPGAYVETYITGGQGGLSVPIGLARDADGNLYVGDRDTANVKRFAPGSRASFAVTLDSASTSPVSVEYATADGTALAGGDYTQTAGTLTFAPGETSKTVSVPVTDDLAGEPSETFRLALSNAVNASLARSQATATVLDNETKFFVVDSGTVKTYEYGSGGTSEEITVPQLSSNTAPRGVATTAAGTTVWVADANKTVYVYSDHGLQLGSWTAGGLPTNAAVEGIATNGTDIWLLANSSSRDKVFKYPGAAGRLSGSQSAASSFKLANGNTTPKDIVTDGTSIWIVDDGTTDKVFKYTLAGASLGSWTIDPANTHPTGLTINPANVSDIWIVDNGTLKVYQYTAAAARTSGSQNAAATFVLNPYNTNPQGIADPPVPTQGAPKIAASVGPVHPSGHLAAHHGRAFPGLPAAKATFSYRQSTAGDLSRLDRQVPPVLVPLTPPAGQELTSVATGRSHTSTKRGRIAIRV